MPQRPVIIVGPGCCGTSFLCGVIEEHFGLCFGHDWKMRTRHQGKLIYESRIVKLSARNGDAPQKMLEKLHREHADEGCTKPPAVKVLDLSLKSAAFIGQLNPRLLIHAYRERVACTASMLRYFKKYRTIQAACARYDHYEWSIAQMPVDIMLNMSRQRSSEEIVSVLSKHLTPLP